MTNAQPESTAERLDRLESLFADMGDVVIAQSEALGALGTQTARNASAIEALTTSVNNLVEQAAADREQAAADRQLAAINRQQANIDRQAWQSEIQRIWEYLLQQGGNGRQGT